MARAPQPLVVETAARASSDHRRIGHGDGAERLPPLQPDHDLRHVRYQALRQVAHLCARVGDDLLALAVIELLRHLGSCWPASRSASRIVSAATANRAVWVALAAYRRRAQ